MKYDMKECGNREGCVIITLITINSPDLLIIFLNFHLQEMHLLPVSMYNKYYIIHGKLPIGGPTTVYCVVEREVVQEEETPTV